MPQTPEFMRAIGAKGGKAKGTNRKTAKLAERKHQEALDSAITKLDCNPSPECALEVRITKLVRAGRTRTLDKLTRNLAILRKSQRPGKRQHYDVSPTLLSPVRLPETPAISAVNQPTQAGPKESLFAATPPTQAPPPPARADTGVGVNTLFTSTSPAQKEVIPSAVCSESKTPSEQVHESVPKSVPPLCPGPQYVKVKVGGHWIWAKPNADFRKVK